MDDLTKLLSKVELTADCIIGTKQQIVDSDAKKHKTREAANTLRNSKEKKRHWICVGDMFIRLSNNEARNFLSDEQLQLETQIDKLRDQLKDQISELRQLENKPEISGFNLKPLTPKEITALRTGFKI